MGGILSNGDNRKSVITDKAVFVKTPPAVVNPQIGWDVNRFEQLIQSQGYDAYIDRALRCPCVDRSTGQALSTCHNCLGRGWIFIERRETRVIAQSMENKKRYEEWSETNLGTASITSRGVDKIGFMDRIILTQIEGIYTEVLRPEIYDGELMCYPVYEPMTILNAYLFVGDTEKLKPLSEVEYEVDRNKIVFDKKIIDFILVENMNQRVPDVSITIRYTHMPVYHAIDINRELMRVRENRFCSYNDETLRQMPIKVMARKAQFIFDAQKYGFESHENTVFNKQ